MAVRNDCGLEHYKNAVVGLAAAFYRQSCRPAKRPTGRRQEIDLPWSEIEHYIDEWIHSETARQMLKEKLHNEDVTFEQLGERHHMTVQSVKKKFYKAEARLYDKIPDQFLKDPT